MMLFAYESWPTQQYIDNTNTQSTYVGLTQNQVQEHLYTGQALCFVTLVILQFGSILSVRTRFDSIVHCNPVYGTDNNIHINYVY